MLDIVKPTRGTVYPPLVPPISKNMRMCMIEPGEPENRGSMGARYVMNAIEAAGFRVDYLEPDADADGYDVELVSVHHCTDFPKLKSLRHRAPIRILGGHPTTNNIRPAIPFADVICVGEGESWIVHAITRIAAGGGIADLADLPGTIISSRWRPGDTVPTSNTVDPLPKHPPYLNRAGEGHNATWYLEMARGCPFRCHYCELGWAWKYRPQEKAYLLDCVDRIDTSQSNRISLFAPDEASHPAYAEVLGRIHERKLVTSFGSMRLDVIVKKDLPLKPNMLIRVGLDGLTEATRQRINKPIKDEDVVNYFRYMNDRGHSNFKIFMVFGYPWERPEDFDEFAALWDRIVRIRRKVNAHVRVKFTPFIPQPSTPLGDSVPNYDPETVSRILEWFAMVKSPYDRPGWFVANDGVMSARSHALQCRLTSGDEHTLTGGRTFEGTETLKGYGVWEHV